MHVKTMSICILCCLETKFGVQISSQRRGDGGAMDPDGIEYYGGMTFTQGATTRNSRYMKTPVNGSV